MDEDGGQDRARHSEGRNPEQERVPPAEIDKQRAQRRADERPEVGRDAHRRESRLALLGGDHVCDQDAVERERGCPDDALEDDEREGQSLPMAEQGKQRQVRG